MNKKVFKVMIALVIVFLVACYILKIFLPEQFVVSIQNETLITLGKYIDNNAWAEYLFGIITAFITYWLYLCAVCKRWYLKWYECLIVLAVIGISIACTFIDTNLYTAISYTSFVFLPLLFKANLKEVGIVYTVHIVSQFMTLSIRNLPLYMEEINTLILTIVGIESYFWLLLFYLVYNYKENKKWAGNSHQCMENIQTEKKEKLPKSTEKLKIWNQINKSIKNAFQRDNLKKSIRKLKLSIKDFIIDELWVYVIVIGSILLCSWIFNRWIEGAMFIVAHIMIRRVFEKQFHFNETAFCLTLTLAIIWFAIPITLPLTASMFSSIPIAFVICFFGYVAQDWVDLIKEKKMKNRFDFTTCTKEDVIRVSNSLGYNKDKQDIAVMFFADRLSNKQVWQILCNTQRNIEWDTVKKYKYRMTKDFKNYINPEESSE